MGLSLAILLAQKNSITAVDIIEEKIKNLNEWKSPIQDEYIEKYFADACGNAPQDRGTTGRLTDQEL